MSRFNILYSGATLTDARTLAEYVDELYFSVGVVACEVNIGKLVGVIQGVHQEFPSPLGVANSSPFKKVAAFTASFAAERPIYTPLPREHFGQLHTHQNAIVAISLSIDALENAVIKDTERGDIRLINRITMSKHYFRDLIAAVSNCVPVHHFDCLSLIFESLAYQVNPGASYDRVV